MHLLTCHQTKLPIHYFDLLPNKLICYVVRIVNLLTKQIAMTYIDFLPNKPSCKVVWIIYLLTNQLAIRFYFFVLANKEGFIFFVLTNKEGQKSLAKQTETHYFTEVCENLSRCTNINQYKKDILKLAKGSQWKINACSKMIVPIATWKSGKIRKRTL